MTSSPALLSRFVSALSTTSARCPSQLRMMRIAQLFLACSRPLSVLLSYEFSTVFLFKLEPIMGASALDDRRSHSAEGAFQGLRFPRFRHRVHERAKLTFLPNGSQQGACGCLRRWYPDGQEYILRSRNRYISTPHVQHVSWLLVQITGLFGTTCQISLPFAY